jgi:hypothetical protein
VRHKLIDWVDAKCSLWGISMRRIYIKQDLHNLHWPESVWGRIQDGVPPSEFTEQRFLEVHEGDALVIARLIPYLTEAQRITLAVHYVMPGMVKEKLHRIRKSREAHYEAVAWIHRKLARAVECGYPDKVRGEHVRACA